MKIRIKGNSIRLRLSKSEVTKLQDTGYIEETTAFQTNKFGYALQERSNAKELSATFNEGKITVFIPSSFIKDWSTNDVIGFDTKMPLAGTDSLYILVEKDFVCLDETNEDQSDNYENPNKAC